MTAILAAISGSGLLSAIVTLVIAGVIFWLVLWFIGWVGLPEPFLKVAKVILGLFALIFLINWLLGLTDHGAFIKW